MIVVLGAHLATAITTITSTSTRTTMSWSSRIGSWGGRFSPFGRAAQSDGTQVTDSDYSYITSDDLARNEEQQTRPARDTDALVLKHRRVSHPVHFPAYSIDDGELTVGDIRLAAAKRLGLRADEAARAKLFYRGKNLKDDIQTARAEGLRSEAQAEILCVIGDPVPRKPESDEEEGEGAEAEEEEEEEVLDSAGDVKSSSNKKRRPRRGKRGKKKSNSGTATPTSNISSPPAVNPDATYAPSTAPPPRKTATPQPSKAPQTALEKLDGLASLFHTKLVPECIQFAEHPPGDKDKREFDHKRLTETILAQVLLKLDAVETESDAEARQRRKTLVKEVQSMLNRLDEVIKA